ncbi:MAG: sigma-70 family RNA polymerase sigma factor [Mycobacterium sp.]
MTRARVERRFASEAFPLRGELMRIARRYTSSIHDAEDLVQDTLVKAWLNFDSCVPGSNLRAWMVRIMVNTWIDNHRKTQRRPREVLAGSVGDAQVSIDRQQRTLVPSAEETALTLLPNDHLRQCIQALPVSLQAALFYADVCQFPVKQIAEIESIPMGTVVSRLHRARRGLRSALSEGRGPSLER